MEGTNGRGRRGGSRRERRRARRAESGAADQGDLAATLTEHGEVEPVNLPADRAARPEPDATSDDLVAVPAAAGPVTPDDEDPLDRPDGPDGGTEDRSVDGETADPVDEDPNGFQVLLDHNPLGALLVDDDARVVLHNERASVLLGTHHDDLVNGRFGHRLTAAPYDITRRDAAGRARTLTLTSTPFPALGAAARLVTIADAVDRTIPRDDPDEHFGSSTHDPLTGLPTRELLLNHLYETALHSPTLGEDRFAIIVIDLERFVRINDEHGHEVGDRVLQAVAARLTSAVRPGDYVSRSGGDEFAVVLGAQPVAAHLGIADRINEVLSQPVVVDGTDIYCTPVIGVAEHVGADDEHDLLARAENALVASATGATRLAPRPSDSSHDRSIHAGAAGAIDEGQVYLHFQPIYAFANNELIALEALARREHPDDGLVVPDDRTTILTEGGDERSLGQWVMAEVCEQIATWRADHPDYLVPTVHINVSAHQVSTAGLRRETADELVRHGLDPSVIRFEITEEVLADPDPRVEALLRDLTADGVELILDRFGTGLSSITHLRRFPLAGLKVDRSFVTRLLEDEPSAQFVLAAIETGRAFHLPVTAVGIEDAEQKAVLGRWGCDLAQGFLLARPVTAVEAPRFFERDPSSLRARPRGPLLRSSGTFVSPTPTP
jgi:diguanylate cyclase (GGDEF)-like protein